MQIQSKALRTIVTVSLIASIVGIVWFGIIRPLDRFSSPDIHWSGRLDPVDFETASPARPLREVEVGDPAPDFSLTGENGKTVRLSDFRGRPVVLVFSRAHW